MKFLNCNKMDLLLEYSRRRHLTPLIWHHWTTLEAALVPTPQLLVRLPSPMEQFLGEDLSAR